uniref:Uncharacterized protein n=1 Tax=Populus trichocarpa TaxID=3694 RepID=A0A2K2CBF7_POPTR
MVKYAAIARGDAEIFLKFAQSEEACGVETNAGPRPLDFSIWGLVACSGRTLHEKLVEAVYAS